MKYSTHFQTRAKAHVESSNIFTIRNLPKAVFAAWSRATPFHDSIAIRLVSVDDRLQTLHVLKDEGGGMAEMAGQKGVVSEGGRECGGEVGCIGLFNDRDGREEYGEVEGRGRFLFPVW